jgi:arylsulfatase A
VAQYPEATKEGQAEYFANVTNLDRAAGKLLAKLDDMKLTEQTLVIFTSDNGPETLLRYPRGIHCHGSPGPLRGMKLHLYDGGIRVPGIMRYPRRIKAGQTSAETICSLDFLPTFCELAGIKLPENRTFDGTNLTPVFEGQPLARTSPLYWHYFRSIGEPKAAMRVGDYAILGKWDGPQLGPGGSVHHGDCEAIKSAKLVSFELYNLKSDLGQQTDLAATEPDKLKELSAQLTARYNEVQEQGPVWDVPKPVEKGK